MHMRVITFTVVVFWFFKLVEIWEMRMAIIAFSVTVTAVIVTSVPSFNDSVDKQD